MARTIRPAVVILLGMIILLGILYPLAVTAIGQVAFRTQANGSLVTADGIVVGSELIGQANSDPSYFWSRPSAIAYSPMPSSGSNLGPTSEELAGLVRQRAADFRAANGLAADAMVPPDMLFASGSGLDPHISPAAARLQVNRVAAARGLDTTVVMALVEDHVESPQLGIFGQPRVNVLALNMALDGLQ